MTDKARVLDACCGGKMFWFDKDNQDVVFVDNRKIDTVLCDGRSFEVKPDVIADFRHLPFDDCTFYHVVFDPPHLTHIGSEAYMCKKYGSLPADSWRQYLHDGFSECMRVLKPNGTLIFKWCEDQIPLKDVLNAIGYEPLYGHKSGKRSKTHWLAFIKTAKVVQE